MKDKSEKMEELLEECFNTLLSMIQAVNDFNDRIDESGCVQLLEKINEFSNGDEKNSDDAGS
jgi:hypothetical protein